MRSLADLLGLSVMTVSRALRNASDVSPETRRRVLDAAREHGYRPDPVLSALNAYRQARAPHRPAKESLAFLTNFPAPDGWKSNDTFQRYFFGAEARANELGYQLDPFWVGDPGLTPKRITQILVQRGVRGLLVGPLAEGNAELKLDWRRFCAVGLGRSLKTPALTQVCPHHTHVVRLALSHVWRAGYGRVGLLISHPEDERTVNAVRTAYVFARHLDETRLAPPLLHGTLADGDVENWVERERIDVVFSSEAKHIAYFAARPALLRRVRFVNLNVQTGSQEPGVDQIPDVIGQHAVGLLHLKLLQRQSGAPAKREIMMIDGVWREGRGAWRLRRQE
ncbi:MAG: LacI family DNA-binding transcriptional regulator [Opitutaceae bacterium]|nr:LacI family DNA-binding transcriptional regulator [Opitutaceae bacterium]